jgi:ParB-like partition proteins
MSALKQKARRQVSGILLLPVEDIVPNALQPRQLFDTDALQELADSIGRYGVLSPLTVRPSGSKWELVAGERRLRAAKLAGLQEVPCISLDVGDAESGVIALVENLQRRDLDYIEEARGIARLIESFGLSQEEVAQRLGKSQSSVANKLRLLHLPPDVQDGLLEAGLTERHGRALLRLGDDDERREALHYIAQHDLTVAAADRYIDRLLQEKEQVGNTGRTLFVLKDVRIFMNTLLHAVDIMRQGGVNVDVHRLQSSDEVTVTISIRR